MSVTPEQIASYSAALDFAEKQVAHLIERYPNYFPMYTVEGKWHHTGELWTHWTDGFLGGMMWQFCARGHEARWRKDAERYSKMLEYRKIDRNVHDLGFLFLSTYLPWYEASGQPELRDTLLIAGQTLSLRFNQPGDYLRSFIGYDSLFIDIMMNVPIIFYAALEMRDKELARIAAMHCRTTADTIVRADGSTAHEGIFDLETGEFLAQTTHQGLRGDSAWARGLAWSLYGYAKCYALTGNAEYLEVSERNAAYWIEHLPEDGVCYWDFDADLSLPAPWGAQKESSAAAIAASGLIDLSILTKDAAKSAKYLATATKMLDALVTPEYLAIETPGWEGILKHGVYHTAKNLGVDESVMWGEYFFVEALTKLVTGKQARLAPEKLAENQARYTAIAPQL